MEYMGTPDILSRLLKIYEAQWPGLLWGPEGLYASRWAPLMGLSWWIAWRLVGFFVLPALAVRMFFERPLRDFGLAAHDLRKALPLYGGMFVLLLPVLGMAAMRPEFLTYYPFYNRAGESWFDLLSWELMYAVHFVALEFFFRGFWLEGSRRALGVHAIAFMIVPYCMIHFTKPVLEVVAAIPAGFVLGVLAMRTRSIWGGAALHIAVAWTMDLLAIAQASGLPRKWWP
jgi:membrane protease YdiL (CAAX protease family)